MRSGLSASAAAITCASSGRPAIRCSTLGSAECMRLPWPAARMTTWRRGIEIGIWILAYTDCDKFMTLSGDYIEMCFRLVAALVAGALIGLERSYRGRPAGFRTHALVCTASSLLMLVTVYEHLWFSGGSARTVLDPTRMSQGIMTGIGFLGAGVIVKEGLSVRGLTTAASIWMTASIGILIGIGFYFPALVTTLLTLSTLTLLRWLEGRVLHRHEVQLYLRQSRQGALHEPALVSILAAHGFSASSVSAYCAGEGRFIDYKAVLTTADKSNGHRLLETLTSERR